MTRRLRRMLKQLRGFACRAIANVSNKHSFADAIGMANVRKHLRRPILVGEDTASIASA